MKTQHTPGPWTAAWPDIQAHGGIVAELNTIDERGHADARLISAAPELLEALEQCADWLARSTRIDDREQAEDARAAIAKAKGETTL